VELTRHGDVGADVSELQTRLERLGFSLPGDERGRFGDATQAAVSAFQRARGIGIDGVIGSVTLRELSDAEWILGVRVLSLRTPMLRGDDVRALQDRLTTLGFDAGKTDGIFGPSTRSAVLEFQRNYGLTEDGICGVETVRALRGLPQMSGDTPSGPLRERERMQPRAAGVNGLRVFLDPGPASEDLSPSHGAALELTARVEDLLRAAGADVERSRADDVIPDDSMRARLANTLHVDLIISLREQDDLPAASVRLRSFGHDRYRSIRGERAATLIAEALLEASAAKLVEHELSTVPMLRETRACAVVVDLTQDCVLDAAARAIAAAVHRCVTLGAYGASS
jgi:N-acetylmuramoyl-L-alanine amidase